MKKYILRVLPFILIFVLFFSSTVCAVDYAPLFCENKPIYDSTQLLIDDAKTSFRSVMGMSESDPVYYICVMYNQGYNYGDGYCWTYIYISNEPIVFSGISDNFFTVRLNGAWSMPLGCYIHNTRYEPATISSDMVNYGYYDLMLSPGPAFLCSSHTVTSLDGAIYLEGIEKEVAPPLEGGLSFDVFLEGLNGFGADTDAIDSTIQGVTIVDNPNNPNEQSLFTILQGLGSMNNNLTDLISYSVAYIGSVLSDIKDIISGLIDNIIPDNLQSIIDSVYEMGLDENNSFSIFTLLKNIVIPREGYIEEKIETVILPKFGFIEVAWSFIDSIKSVLNQTDTIMPVITTDTFVWQGVVIPPFTISFEWYLRFKPYVDPVVSAFCWITFVYHTIVNLPSLFRGGKVTSDACESYSASVDAKMRSISDSEKIARNFGWK